MITVLGLGCSREDLSEGANAAIRSGAKVILRTGVTPAAQAVRELADCETLDYIYERSRTFDALNKKLAAAVLEAAQEQDVVYCVDGSVAEDISAQIVVRRGKGVRVLSGVSKSEAAFAAAKIGACNRMSVSAYSMGEGRLMLPLAVYDIDCDLIAGDVKIRLCELFGDEACGFFVCGGRAKRIKVYELDRQGGYDGTCVFVMDSIPLLKKTRFCYDDLVQILQILRSPDGCPWDRAQTHESIRKNMIEEAYELVDAIDSKDDSKILEETGDVLMQGAFHAIMGQERGAFTADDVLSEVCRKLIFRHSHIFGKDKATDETSALSVWEKNKQTEKGQNTGAESLRDVPVVLPALMRAQKVAKRAAKYGYDFQTVEEASKKVGEELEELLAAVAGKKEGEIAEEVGDLLFSAANVGRLAGADCEESLKASTQKFIERFCRTEELIGQDGKRMQDLDAESLWAYYERAKRAYEKDG